MFTLSGLAQKLAHPKQLLGRKAQPVPRRQLSQPAVSFAPAPAPANFSRPASAQTSQSGQAQGGAAVAASRAAAGNAGTGGLVANGQLSQNAGNAARFGSQGYQVYTPATPQRLSTQEAAATPNNPSLVDAGTTSGSGDVSSNAQQQLRTAPAAPTAATR